MRINNKTASLELIVELIQHFLVELIIATEISDFCSQKRLPDEADES